MINRIVVIFIFVIHSLTAMANDDWNLVSDHDGIALYTRALKGHTTSEFKGVCVANHPIETVGSILSDIGAYPRWFFRCIQSHKIPAPDSSDHNFLLYIAIDTPWPFSDRDAVYRVTTTIDSASGKVVVHSTALKAHHVAPIKNYVRITDSHLQWILERLSAAKTRITFINRTHAAGSWGDYISNSGIRATTLNSLRNLKKMLQSGSFAQRHQQDRAWCFFKNRHSDIVDSPETHFFRELVTTQNDQIRTHFACNFTRHQGRISRQTPE
jgi:hypothetical protein